MPVVIDRTRALRRVDRLLEDLREVARMSYVRVRQTRNATSL